MRELYTNDYDGLRTRQDKLVFVFLIILWLATVPRLLMAQDMPDYEAWLLEQGTDTLRVCTIKPTPGKVQSGYWMDCYTARDGEVSDVTSGTHQNNQQGA